MAEISAITLATVLALHPVTMEFAGRLGGYARDIDKCSEKYELRVPVVIAVILKESSGKAKVLNYRSRASGLMQVMPSDSAPELRHYFTDRPTSKELRNDPGLNIDWGCKILRHKLDKHGDDLKMALFDYSGGDHGGRTFEQYEESYWSVIVKYIDALEELEQVCWRLDICQG